MYTIKESSILECEIKKSKFITLLYHVENSDDIKKYLEEVKKVYKDATHYCFAYKLKTEQKFSDDGEPSGTAGLPIMEILNKKNLNYILCIVVRYFGGIKLGASGLARAYRKVVRDAIDNNVIIELEEGYSILLETNYEQQKQLDYILSSRIRKKEFKDKVIYYLEISHDDIDLLKNYNYQILESIMIEHNKKPLV